MSYDVYCNYYFLLTFFSELGEIQMKTGKSPMRKLYMTSGLVRALSGRCSRPTGTAQWQWRSSTYPNRRQPRCRHSRMRLECCGRPGTITSCCSWGWCPSHTWPSSRSGVMGTPCTSISTSRKPSSAWISLSWLASRPRRAWSEYCACLWGGGLIFHFWVGGRRPVHLWF